MRRLVYGLLTAATLLGALAQGATALASPPGERGYLGVQIGPDKAGAELLSVRPDSAAEQAGLKEGDVVVSISGSPVASVDDLVNALGKLEAGDTVELGIKRGDEVKVKTVKLGSRPASLETESPEPAEKPAPPARKLREMREAPEPPAPDRSGGYLGVLIDGSSSGGVLIADVRPGSPAEKGRLKAGDLIVALDGASVGSAEDLKLLIGKSEPGEEVQVVVIRDGEKMKRIVKLASFQELSWPETVTEAPRPPAPPKRAQTPKPPAPPAQKAEKKGGRGWIGIYYADAEEGVLVDNTVPGGPAENAGLAAGDRIISVDGAEIEGSEDLLACLDKAGPKSTIAVMVIRDGRPLEFDVTLGHAPETVVETVPLPEKRPAPEAKKSKQEARVKAQLAKAKMAKVESAEAKKARAQEAKAKKAKVRAGKAKSLAVAKNKKALLAQHSGALRLREPLGAGSVFTIEEDGGTTTTIIIIIVEGSGRGCGGCCCCGCCCKSNVNGEQKMIEIIEVEEEVDSD
ncbi:MAG: PDZ domain-containing protein [Planctomycetota bacterium]